MDLACLSRDFYFGPPGIRKYIPIGSREVGDGRWLAIGIEHDGHAVVETFRMRSHPGPMSLLLGYTELNQAMPRSIGDKLGPYEILAPIGAGGMGAQSVPRCSAL